MTQREIKFRAWDKVEKVMSYEGNAVGNGAYLIEDEGKWIDITGNVPHFVEFMQYTGLKDKNGKEIYEGDIVKIQGAFTLGEGVLREVKPDGDGGYLPFSRMWASGGCVHPAYDKNSAEVIGNIYENPELLDNKSPCQ